MFQDTEGKLLSLSENYNVRNDAECLEKLWKQAYTISIEVNFFLLKNFITEQFNKENALGLGNVFAFAFEKLEDLQEKISSKFQRDQPSITDLLKRNKQEFEILIEKETKKLALNQF